MTVSVQTEHQDESAIIFDIEAGEMVEGANAVCHLPPGAVVTGGFVAVLTVFDAACTIDIGDGTVANRYGNDLDIHAATGTQNLTITGDEVTAATEQVKITPSAVDSVTGKIRVCLKYVVMNRSKFAVG